MKTSFELDAEFRDAQGKGASRRLRHANKVPAILYGGHRDPRALSLDHTKLLLLLDNERFYSTIINLKVGELNQAAILKDVQRHPAKNAVVHIDLQRVLDDEKIRITIPLHFKGEAGSPGVKKGGVVSHLRNEVEITCLPKDLPEFVEVDLSADPLVVAHEFPGFLEVTVPLEPFGYASDRNLGRLGWTYSMAVSDTPDESPNDPGPLEAVVR